MRIDLNADVGETPTGHPSDDAVLMRVVTSVNIAAGGHAGDAESIRHTVRLARAHGVAVGAHPSFVDREGFGRRDQVVDPSDLERLVLDQIVAVATAASDAGIELQHVKPHGALYNMAALDATLARAIAAAIALFDHRLLIVGPPHSQLLTAGRAAGLKTLAEAFVDRAYAPDGSLVPRSIAGAVLEDPDAIASRAVRLAVDRTVVAVDGSVLSMDADTLCLHGDTPGAARIGGAVRLALEAAHVTVRAPGRA